MTHVALLIALVQMQVPAWAFPSRAADPPGGDSVAPLHVPGSRATFTEAQVNNVFFVMDWFPGSHPTMPDIVARGRKPSVLACGYCHLADGAGRPENAMLAGLPADYIIAQVADMKSGARRGAWHGTDVNVVPSARMAAVASAATSDEIAQAAHYFAALRPRQRGRVVEATDIPKTTIGRGLYLPAGGGTEPLGQRLIEVPEDVSRHERHDPYVTYIAYVPRGSIARGHTLAATVCMACHGDDLRGLAPTVPPLAGRSPSYILRQLLAFKTGARASGTAAPMRAFVANLSLDDMIAAAAYAGTLTP
jgi:cytochrome c553